MEPFLEVELLEVDSIVILRFREDMAVGLP